MIYELPFDAERWAKTWLNHLRLQRITEERIARESHRLNKPLHLTGCKPRPARITEYTLLIDYGYE